MTGSGSGARVAAAAEEPEIPAAPADARTGEERGSLLQLRSVVDAVVASEPGDDDRADEKSHHVDADPRSRRRRLSTEDQRRIHKTSLILTHPQAQVLVLSHARRTRLQCLQDKVFPPHVSPTPHPAPSAARPQRATMEDARRWLRVHIKTRAFRSLLYGVVLCDTAALAMDEGTSLDTAAACAAIDVACTLLLFLEIAVKSFAFGLVRGRDAYLARGRRGVRLLNALLLALGLVSHVVDPHWRILRGLKTFRCLTLYAGLRRIVRSLGRAIPFLANVATLALFFLFAFSIFGLEAYRGAFDRQCRWDLPQDANNQSFWTELPRKFCSSDASCGAPLYCNAVPPPSKHITFDSGLSALFLVFLVVAQDGWVTDIMEPVVEATSLYSTLFFVAIVASMVFLVVNLFVAVITTSFMNFSVENAAEKAEKAAIEAPQSLEATTHNDDEDEEDGVAGKVRGSMIKMRPEDEETRVSLIMGATLAIEESIQQQQCQGQGVNAPNEPTPEEHSKIARMLARTHKYHSLRNLTVDATRELIANPSPVDEFLVRTVAATRGSVPGDAALDGPDAAPSPSPSPRKPTRLVDVPYGSSLVDVVVKSSGSPTWFVAFQRAVLSKRFDDAITGCIVVNTAFLLVEYPTMPSWVRAMLSVAEYFFGAVFFLEMVVRIVAMRGIRRYLHSTERFFDMVVVLCTSVNIVFNNLPSVTFSGLNSVSSLRTLRVSRLMMKWEGTRKLIESVLKSSRGVLDVVVFLILFQVVSSIVAMQLFGGDHLGTPDEPTRWNFDTFFRSFLTLLQVITADQWSSITYDAVNAANPHPLLVPYLIVNFIIGQYVLLNLFIAVILENFSITEEEAYQLQLEQIIAIPKELDIYEKIEEEGVRAFGEMEQLENVSNVKLRMFLGIDADSKRTSTVSAKHMPAQKTESRVVLLLRRFCRRVARNPVFSRLVQLMILVSCVTLVLEDPHPEMRVTPPDEKLLQTVSVLNHVALGVFVVEFLVKVGANGFGFDYLRMVLFHSDERLGFVKRQAYIEDKWNQLDCFLLVLTVADEVISQYDGSMRIARMFRAGRVLRPLRILNHNHEMKRILSAVAQSLPHVGNVFGLCIMVYIIFGVVGRSLFSGLFYSCNDPSVTTIDECVGFYPVQPDGALALQEATARSVQSGEILVPRVWANARFSFDNVGAASLALLEMTSLKWIDKTFAAMDITGLHKQPQQDHSPHFALFFVLFVYLGSLFVIRLFVGVLVEQFQRNNGTQILTESQKSWVDLEKFVLLLKPLKRVPRPKTALQNALYDLCQHRYFSRVIAVAILLNVALLLFNPSNSGSSDSDSTSSKVIEVLFLVVFSSEALLKCLAFRHHYVLSSTGAFELGILGGSLAAYSLATGVHTIIQAGRVFRMMRVLRFVRLNRGVYAVFQTFRASIKPIGHIFFLLFMIFFIFAIVGRQLFGGVRFGPSLNGFSNFRSFSSSFLLLFQIMAGDDWHLTMTDCMLSPPFCVERVDPATGKTVSDCGSPAGAVVFFVTYVTLVVFFLLNLFIAVVLENFRSCYLQGDVCPISLHDFEAYREVFMKYDVDNRGTFPLWQLASFLADLPPGLRVDRRQSRTAFLQLRSQVQALQEGWAQQRCKRPFFNDLLRVLCIHQLGIRSLPYEQQRDRVKQIFIYRAKVADMLVESAVKGYVQRWKRRKEKEKMEALRSKMRPEAALMKRLSDVGRRRSWRSGATAEEQEPPKEEKPIEKAEEAQQQQQEQQQRRRTSSVVAQTFVLEALATVVANVEAQLEEEEEASGVTQSTDETSESDGRSGRRKHKQKKHRHKKHRHKKREAADAVVTPQLTEEEDDGTESDQPALVPKRTASYDQQPLHAPRRLPKITNKVVPT